MEILKFVEEYNKCIDRVKDDYIKKNVKIKTYIPFIEKITYAKNILNVTMFDVPLTNKEDTPNFRNINTKSEIEYLLFCRTIIERYTDLTSTTSGWYEEYDALNQSGLLERFMIGGVNGENIIPPLIPEKETTEFKSIMDMMKSDIISNYATLPSIISNQFERFSFLLNKISEPIMKAISDKITNINKEDIEDIMKLIEILEQKNDDINN